MNKTMETVSVWLENVKTAHDRLMMRYLRNRGWVVFYLPVECRTCKDECWMEMYRGEEGKG